MEILLAAIALFLLVISGLLWLQLKIQVRQNAAILSAISPKQYSFIDAMSGQANEPRTIIDQLGMLQSQTLERIESIEAILKYLRDYTWQVKDPRFIEDVLNPKGMDGKRTDVSRQNDAKSFGLWWRERDLEESFDREVRQPAARGDSKKD